MQSVKKSSTNKWLLNTDYTAGLNSEKSTTRTLLQRPDNLTISKAYSEVSPPTTLGAETPGIHLLLMESVSKDTKIV